MRVRDQVAVGGGLAAFVVAVFVLGGVERWTQAIVAGLIALASIPLLASRRVFDRWPPLVVLPGLAALLTALQLVPLPAAVMTALDSTGSGLRDDGAELLALHPWSAVTLDPASSLRALTSLLILIGVATLALRAAVTERGRYRLLAVVAATCGLVAIVVGIHVVLRADALYGIYTPREARPSVLGPLLNQNHLGCLMGMGTLVALGLVFHGRQPSSLRALWLVVVGACGATTVATHSRGATLALGVGAVVAIGARLAQRFSPERPGQGRRRATASSLPMILVAAAAVVVVVYASAGGVTDRLSRTTVEEAQHPKSKFMAWRAATALVEEAPVLGIGRGALDPVFTRVHPASAVATYTYVENEYVQAVVDWGIAGAAVVGLAAIWLLVVAGRRWRDGPLAAGALGALAMVLTQSNVDFGIEMLGVAIPATVIVATLTYVPVRDGTGERLRHGRVARAALCAGLLASVGLLFSRRTEPVAESHDRLRAATTLDQLRPVCEQHPLDYFCYARAAQLLQSQGDRDAVRLLNHAMLLHPYHRGLHLLAAQLLLRSGLMSQATIEYGLALRGTLEPRPILAEITRRLPAPAAAAAIPTDYTRLDEISFALIDLGHRDVAIAWIEHVLDRGATMHACEQYYAVALPTHDLELLGKAVRRCHDFEPDRDARLQLARLFLASNRYDEVDQLLHDADTWDGRIDDKRAAWLMTCDAKIGRQQWQEGRHCLHLLEAAGLADAATTSAISTRMDQIAKAVQDGANTAAPGPR